MVKCDFILLVLLKSFGVKVENFFVKMEKTRKKYMNVVNFLFEKLGWEKVNLDFLKVESNLFSSKEVEKQFVEIWEKNEFGRKNGIS